MKCTRPPGPLDCHSCHSPNSPKLRRYSSLLRDELEPYLGCTGLHLAGCELPLFEPAAIEALFQASRGLPRQVNRIAHFALTAAALDQLHTVNIRHLEHGCAEIMP